MLPPDVAPPEGEGFVAYVVQPKATDPTGTVINAQATVIFQAGLPNQSSLNTPAIFNTIDAVGPTSSVTALPTFSPANFTVNWSGQDDTGGSGIAYYNVYVADDNGPFTLWQSATSQTSAIYTGQDGHTYGFLQRRHRRRRQPAADACRGAGHDDRRRHSADRHDHSCAAGDQHEHLSQFQLHR